MSPQDYASNLKSENTSTLLQKLQKLIINKAKATNALRKAEQTQEFAAFRYWGRYAGLYSFQIMCISEELEKRLEI